MPESDKKSTRKRRRKEQIVIQMKRQDNVWVDSNEMFGSTEDALRALSSFSKAGEYRIIGVKRAVGVEVENKPTVTLTERPIQEMVE